MQYDFSFMKSFGNIDHSLIAGTFPFQGKFFLVHLKFTVYADIQITHNLFFADLLPEETCIKPDCFTRISLSDLLRKGCYLSDICRVQWISTKISLRSASPKGSPPFGSQVTGFWHSGQQ